MRGGRATSLGVSLPLTLIRETGSSEHLCPPSGRLATRIPETLRLAREAASHSFSATAEGLTFGNVAAQAES